MVFSVIAELRHLCLSGTEWVLDWPCPGPSPSCSTTESLTTAFSSVIIPVPSGLRISSFPAATAPVCFFAISLAQSQYLSTRYSTCQTHPSKRCRSHFSSLEGLSGSSVFKDNGFKPLPHVWSFFFFIIETKHLRQAVNFVDTSVVFHSEWETECPKRGAPRSHHLQ